MYRRELVALVDQPVQRQQREEREHFRRSQQQQRQQFERSCPLIFGK